MTSKFVERFRHGAAWMW